MTINKDCIILISRYLDEVKNIKRLITIIYKENYKEIYNDLKKYIFFYKLIDENQINENKLLNDNKNINYEDLYYYNKYKPSELFFPKIYKYNILKVYDNKIINLNNRLGSRSVCTKYPFPKQTLFNKIYHLIKYDEFIYVKQQSVFYYEIQIESLNQNSEEILLGFCNNNFCLVNFNVGDDKNSYGLNINNGKIYYDGNGEKFIDTLNIDNDIYGCGYIFNGSNYDIFYTKNGNFIDYAFHDINLSYFYPCISINSNKKILVNFDYNYFLFDVNNFENLYVFKSTEYISKVNYISFVKSIEYNYDNKVKIYNLIYNYLQKKNYNIDNDYEIYETLIYNIYQIIKLNIHDSKLISKFEQSSLPLSFLIFNKLNLEKKISLYNFYNKIEIILYIFFILIPIYILFRIFKN